MTELDWLPDELHLVALRVARADELCVQATEGTWRWSHQGPVDLVERQDEHGEHLVVHSVAPVPPRIGLAFSEAVNHLRAALDNVVFHLAGRELEEGLTNDQERVVALPITKNRRALKDWRTRMRKADLPHLAKGPVGDRIAELQPFRDAGRVVESASPALGPMLGMTVHREHPLRLLQEYSNADKHRAPHAVGHAGFKTVGWEVEEPEGTGPLGLAPGDVIASLPPGKSGGPVEIWPYVVITRPGATPVAVALGHELEAMVRYVADVAIPVLLTGQARADGVPTSVDLDTPETPLAQRLADGNRPTVRQRLSSIMAQGLVEAELREPERARRES